MICTIMQPAYLPWLGYFERILMSDLLIVLDHVDIDRNSKTKFANRNRIRTSDSWQWLTVPITTKHTESLQILDLEIQTATPWQQKHLSSIRHAYSKAPYYHLYTEFIQEIYSKKWDKLLPLCDFTLEWLLKAFDIQTKVLHSSQIKVPGQKDALIRNLCLAVEADTYISGPYGRDYLNLEAFQAEEIEVVFHHYKHPEYQQTYSGFEPYMSAIDLLFNCGPNSLEILNTSKTPLR